MIDTVYRLLENATKYVIAVAGGVILGAFLMWAAQQQASIAKTAAHTQELQECLTHFKDYVDSHPPPNASAQQERIDELTTELARVEKTAVQLKDENATLAADKERIARQAAEMIAVNANVATVLYESAPIDPRLAAVQTVLTLAGHPLPLPNVAGMRPRWFIPARVQPTVYGDPRGTQLLYVDAAGNHQGPFLPLTLPGAR